MIDRVLTYSEKLGYSRLFLDFIYHPEKLNRFLNLDCDLKLARTIAAGTEHRAEMAELLRHQNKKWSAPDQVFESISKIEEENGVAVLTGQQACLFGGPYLAILKAMSAKKQALRMEKKLGVPVVPVFWIAAEDHDYQEISSVNIFDAASELSRLAIDCDPDGKYPPVGALSYDQSIEREISRMQSLLPDNDYRTETLKPIEQIYRPGRNIADCFAEYMLSLIGHLGIVFFNPYDKRFKTYSAPLMQEIISRHTEIKEALAGRESQLIELQYHVQVQKSVSSAHLFCHIPERTAMHRDSDLFRAGERVFSETELIEAIGTSPLDFSPDALTRPLLQSCYFPAVAVVGGPAEVAYYAQIGGLFDIFDLPRPQMLPRASLTVVEKRFERVLDTYNIPFEQIALDPDSVVDQALKGSYPADADEYLAEMSVRTNDDLRKLKDMFTEPDRVIDDMIDRAGEKMDFQLRELGRKMFAAHKRKNRTERDKFYRTHKNLFPDRNLAERSIAPAYLISRYSRSIIDYIYENIDLDETGHRLLMLSE